MKDEFLSPIGLCLAPMDRVRSWCLKRVLRYPLARRLFTIRAYRLSVFAALSLSINLAIALYFPLWALLLGPLLLGIPHLLSTIRHVAPVSKRAVFQSIGAVFVSIALLRIFFGGTALFTAVPGAFESLAAAAALGILWGSARGGLKNAFYGVAGVGILTIATFLKPLETVGFLILAHNFVAFFYWIKQSASPRDRKVAFAALAAFSGGTAAILTGAFDSVLASGSSDILNGMLNTETIGAQVLPTAADPMFWARAVSAYAFGQGVHYFVWMKAIPEQGLGFEHAVSFRGSYRLLARDFGGFTLAAAFLMALGLLVYGAMTSLPEARLVYFSLAAFHGYFEIAGLFITAKTA